jgi:hypothetical protein
MTPSSSSPFWALRRRSTRDVSVVGQVANLRTDCQSVHTGAARTRVAYALVRAASRLVSKPVPARPAGPVGVALNRHASACGQIRIEAPQ